MKLIIALASLGLTAIMAQPINNNDLFDYEAATDLDDCIIDDVQAGRAEEDIIVENPVDDLLEDGCEDDEVVDSSLDDLSFENVDDDYMFGSQPGDETRSKEDDYECDGYEEEVEVPTEEPIVLKQEVPQENVGDCYDEEAEDVEGFEYEPPQEGEYNDVFFNADQALFEQDAILEKDECEEY